MKYSLCKIAFLFVLSYSISSELSAQPLIDYRETMICYDDSYILKIVNPVSQPSMFEWQYTISKIGFDANGNFSTFTQNIVNSLEQYIPFFDSGSFIFSNVSNAIYSTDYRFMQKYYKLYLGGQMQKGEIAKLLHNGILAQNPQLTTDEKTFLSSYEGLAYNELEYWEQHNLNPAPFNITFTDDGWRTMGYSSESYAAFGFIPENFIPPNSGFTTLRIRVISGSNVSPFIVLDVYPKPPTFVYESTRSCQGSQTGTITLKNVTGYTGEEKFKVYIKEGLVPEYEYFQGATYSISRKFAPGTYKIGVEYDNSSFSGCRYDTYITIDPIPEVKAEITSTKTTCPGTSDGSIEIKNIVYEGQYEIFLDGSRLYQTTITSLKGNIDYLVTIKDICSTFQKLQNVGELLPVDIDIPIKTDPTCKSSPNGSIVVNTAGGNGLYNYKLFKGEDKIRDEQGSTGLKFESLPGGNYTIQVSSNGCPYKTSSAELKPVEDVSFTCEVADVDCFGQNTGSIKINASGGQTPYNYGIGNGSYSTESLFQSLASGIYSIKVHTANLNCNDFAEKQIEVRSSPELRISLSGVNLNCFEDQSGSISAVVTGGNGGYSYYWTQNGFPHPGAGNQIDNLYAGEYGLRLTDIKNCQSTQKITIKEPAELKILSAIPSNVVCFGDKGSITVNASGGTGSYTFSGQLQSGEIYESSTPLISVPSGQFVVRVRDGNNCQTAYNYEEPVRITAPSSALDFSHSLSGYNGFNLACNGDASGRISILATGGNGPGYSGYTYFLNSTPQSGSVFDHLSSGSWSVGVKDGRGCLVQKNVTLNQPDPVTMNVLSVRPVKCFGAAEGEILVSASGGIHDSYSYLVNESAGSPDGYFRNLYPGTYNIRVTDRNGCSKSLQETVANLNPRIQTSLSKQDVLCFAAANGRINAGVSGGAGGFSYSWERREGALWQSIQGSATTISGLGPGFYRIMAKDAESCVAFDSIIVAEPERLIVNNVAVRDAVCYGENGMMTIQATGGTGAYSYLVNGSSFNYDGPSGENAIPAGNYAIKVRDANACEASFLNEVKVGGPPAALDFSGLISSFNGYSVSCHGSKNGEIKITATGGNGGTYSGYEYMTDAGSWQGDPDIRNLGAGSYLLKVRDGRGCITQKTFSLIEPSPLELSLLYNLPVKCFGQPQGEISVRTIGGVQDSYIYSLNGSETLSNGKFGNLYAGTYRIGVTDKNGCTSELFSSIEHKNPALRLNLLASDVRCHGENNGSVRSEISGGAGVFTYKWSQKTDDTWKTVPGNAEIGSLMPGLYRLKGTDSDNCSISDSTIVKEPETLFIRNVNVSDAVCLGDSGSIELSAAGGNNGYIFHTAFGQENTFREYLSGGKLIPGTYRLRVRDSKGCEALKPEAVTITKPDQRLVFTTELKNYNGYNVSCHGNNDGEIIITPNGGNGYGYEGYNFILRERAVQTERRFSGLQAGTYDISVIDGRGCRTKGIAVINEPAATIGLRLSSVRNPVCSYDSNGEVSLLATGGVEPYSWSVGNGEFLPDSRFSGLQKGKYLFRVKDSNGCGNELEATLISTDSEMIISGIVSDARCFGESSGSIKVLTTGGSLPYSYSWNQGTYSGSLIERLAKGSYSVIVTDSAGCRSQKNFFLSEPAIPLSLAAVTKPACVGLKDGEILATALGGTSPYMYALGKASDFSPVNIFKVRSGTHKIFASDKNGCITSVEAETGVRNVMPDQNFMIATSRYELDTLVVIDVSVPRPDRTVWEFPEATVIDTASSIARIKYNTTGIYPVKMTGWFSGCAYTAEKLLNIAPFDPLAKEQDKYHKGIKSVRLLPNPNDGHFKLEVELYTLQKVSIRIFDYNARPVFDEKFPACTLLNEEVRLTEGLLPGTYYLWVICEDDARSQAFVISK